MGSPQKKPLEMQGRQSRLKSWTRRESKGCFLLLSKGKILQSFSMPLRKRLKATIPMRTHLI
jgi:hypothetical protein